MKRIVLALSLSLLLLPVLAWAETFSIPGSGGPQLVLRDAAAEFNQANPGNKVEVPESSGTGGGYKAVGEGSAPLGRVSRPPNDKEKPFGVTYLPFGKVPVVFATHPSVKLTNITSAQARDLFTGVITNWKELGGPDLKVRIISRHPTEANLLAIKAALPEWKELVITEKSKLGNTDQEAAQFISENEGAVGFSPVGEARGNRLNILSLNGARPGSASYPVTTDAAFIYKPEGYKGAVKGFVDFIFSDRGQEILKENYLTPVKR